MAESKNSERMHLPISRALAKEVDEWRRRQPDIPARSPAIRRLLEIGLKTEAMSAAKAAAKIARRGKPRQTEPPEGQTGG